MDLRIRLRRKLSRLVVPAARWWLRKTRHARYQGIRVTVPPGVFHPGLFLSTRFMMEYLEIQPIQGKKLLEIGAGSGMVSIWAARQGAVVTATDISKLAVAAIQSNAEANATAIAVCEADLFDGLPVGVWDWVIINPPYYQGDPQNEAEYAFYCGSEFQYFERLWAGLAKVATANSEVRMVLSEDCNWNRINDLAREHGWELVEVARKMKMAEWTLMYAARRISR